jgi:hypothetical protein
MNANDAVLPIVRAGALAELVKRAYADASRSSRWR